MPITEIINKLQTYQGPDKLRLRAGVDESLLLDAEILHGVILPDDFREFYRFSDGFEANEDLFNLIQLDEIIENKKHDKKDPLYIAEYMIYSDMWCLEVNPDDRNDYKIIVEANYNKLVLTNSLAEFINRFLAGGVFDPGGLYDWADEVEARPIYTTKLKVAEILLTFFYHALRNGIVSKNEVIDWADQLVLHEDKPEAFFMELSLCREKNELISLLNTVYVPESDVAARAILGVLYHRLSGSAITADEATAVIGDYQLRDLLTPFESAKISNFGDEAFLEDSITDSDELKENLLQFLAHYKEFEITNYKYWFGISQRIQYKFAEKAKELNTDYKASKAKPPIPLWQIKAVFYTFAFISIIVLLIICNKVEDNIPLSKFVGDAYQMAALYFTFFICYCIFKSVPWMVKKSVNRFKKISR